MKVSLFLEIPKEKKNKPEKIATIYNKNISMFREYAAKFFNVVWVPNHNRKEQKKKKCVWKWKWTKINFK